MGCVTAKVEKIRQYKNQNDHGFIVVHEPDEGIQHAEIGYDKSDVQEFTKNDKSELRYALEKIFNRKSPHTCPPDPQETG